jgi:hypothetical protein
MELGLEGRWGTDLLEYDVYRRRKVGKGIWKTQSHSFVEIYLDKDVEQGQEFDYLGPAVNSSVKRMSPYSEEVGEIPIPMIIPP